MKHDFIDIMHERLSQHEMIEPSGLWQDIEKSLDSRDTPKKGLVARRSAFYKAVAGVAAVALVAVVMWTALNAPSKMEMVGESVKSPSWERAATQPPISPSVETRRASSSEAEGIPPSKIERGGEGLKPLVEKQLACVSVTDSSLHQEEFAKENFARLETDTATNQVDTPVILPRKHELQHPQLWAITEKAEKNSRRPEFALSYNGVLASAGSKDNLFLDYAAPGYTPQNSSSDPSDPQTHETVNVDEKEQIVPVRIGLEVWYPISDKWRVGSGIIYTRLSRKKTTTYITGDKLSWHQKRETASYLGVPLEVSRILWNRKRWSFYASAGAMIEFNLRSKLREKTDVEIINEKEFKDRRPQFSALGRLGLQYNVADRIGIYLEPGASYYFNNGADDNIYMSHPFRFDINLGLKINLGK
mgnify:CR=1 FL=1